jgi:hypothetical protein
MGVKHGVSLSLSHTHTHTHTHTVRDEHRLRVLRMYGRGGSGNNWRRLHNEELHNLYASLNIIRVIKSRRIRWAGHVACTIYMYMKGI